MVIKKQYYNMEEAASILQISQADLVYYASIGSITFNIFFDYSGVKFIGNDYVQGYKGFYAINKNDIKDSILLHKSHDTTIYTSGLFLKDITEFCHYIDNRDVDSIPVFGYKLTDIIIFHDDIVGFSSHTRESQDPLTKCKGSTTEENPKTINSLLTIIITMAINGYSYDPKETRSDTAKLIANDADRLGLRISDDTVRKWLRISADLLNQ